MKFVKMFTFPNSPGYSCFAKLMSIFFSLTLFLLEITFWNCTMSLFAQVGKYNGLTLLLDAETYDYWYQVMFSICFQTAMELFFSLLHCELWITWNEKSYCNCSILLHINHCYTEWDQVWIELCSTRILSKSLCVCNWIKSKQFLSLIHILMES